ncbi:hypothetical protein NC651_040343 [Populus alba x Populus x berolinensis]|nr:hypothetical protein NC651_040343 [Populus alba x Populus x berolinensis]
MALVLRISKDSYPIAIFWSIPSLVTDTQDFMATQ